MNGNYQASRTAVTSSPSPALTPRWATPPRIDIERDMLDRAGIEVVTPRWPLAASVEEAIASWPSVALDQGARKISARPDARDVPAWRAPSGQLKVEGSPRKTHKALGSRGPPERMWSQPAPPQVSSPLSAADTCSAPQSPHHSPSSPSFPSRNTSTARSSLAGAKQAAGTRNAPVSSSPRGRAAVDDVHRRGAWSQTARDVRERSPSGPRRDSEAAACESSRRSLHGTRGKRPLASVVNSPPTAARCKAGRERVEMESRSRGTVEDLNASITEQDTSRTTQHKRELAALRATLENERLERQKFEAMSEDAAGKLAKAEAYLGTLDWELKEVFSMKEEIQRQLKEKIEKRDAVFRRVQNEQEHRRGLEADLAKVAMTQRDLESRARRDQGEKASNESLVKDLQLKLREFEASMAAAGGMRRQVPSSDELPAGVELQLDHLRKQLEDTVRLVQHRVGSGDGVEKPVEYHGQSAGSIGAVNSEQSHTHLSLLDTTSPCSSRSLEPVAAMPSSSVEELGDDMAKEEELPTHERLIGEWSGQFPGSSAPHVSACRSPSASSRPLAAADNGGVETSPAPSPSLSSTAKPMGNVVSLRDLSEIKTLKKPPPPIRMLMEVCCLLFHIKPVKHLDEKNSKRCILDYWEPARRYLLSDPFFPAKLRMHEASHISNSERTKIRRYFRDPEFSAERVRSCSKAAFELYGWAHELVERDAPRDSSNGLAGTC